MPRHGTLIRQMLLRGLPAGVVLLGITLGIEKAFGIDWHDPRGLGHGHGHGEGGHH